MLGIILKHSITIKTSLAEVRSIYRITQKYFICDKDLFSAATIIRTFLTRCSRFPHGTTQQIKSNKLLQNLLVQRRQMSQFDVNMNVKNNVILYKFERNTYFRNLKIFAIGQLLGWSVVAFYTYRPSFWDIFNTDIKFKEFLKNNMICLTMFIFSSFAGPFMSLFLYATCARSIKYIILNKGGKTISIVTYHLLKKKSSMSLPVEMVKLFSHRTSSGSCIPLKIKNKRFYYLIDKSGTFVNPKLFDYTLG
ncbi:transmembrane protein 223 isoform X1 [Pogonomyrmex barbatus]|uniref:Transmembrane protein 223 isoform X1 n=1 Tax=Pogonomyrmex barbatus TaxID=144034 RepID=A0A6I9XJU2_9HYME|nr:transmembrane protein 223 isoform X1 [Pogonomyrmex barbatus]XP_011646031.1 transmembrane protein 223 isoform X1 [Pogonomyrmex barbatus]XP_011646032.1 transmembrane protein 223 isoform X1 [Pogonomyrmex barbatus]